MADRPARPPRAETREIVELRHLKTAQPELAALHDDLTRALQSRGFPVDERPYAPHLTLARRSTTVIDRRLSQPIRWRVNSFTLMASELASSGPAYRTIAEWSLVTA